MHIPAHLIESIKEGNCVLFVGAGLSLGAGLPTWGWLMSELIEELEREKGHIRDKDDIQDLIDDYDFLDVAEVLRERLGDTAFLRFMRRRFADTTLQPQATHTTVTQIGFSAILTTNYDTLIENAYSPPPPVYTQQQASELAYALREDNFYVLKVHGDIHQAGTIVLGKSDYQRLMYANPAYKQYLSSLLSTKTVLFIGFSMSDPDLIALFDELKVAFVGHNNNHYALMSDETVSPIKAKRYKKNFNLDIITYTPSDNTHPEVLEFLQTLVEATTDTDTSPSTVPTKPTTSDKDYIFISYARPDEAYAEQAETYLTGLGYRVFRDKTTIRVGDDWNAVIEKALHETDKMVLLLSSSSMPDRKEVEREWFYFDQNDKPILPLYLEACTLNSRLLSINYIDARNRFDEALQDLAQALDVGFVPERSALSLLADQPNDQTIAMPDWIHIPAGTFTMGAEDLGISEREVTLPEFLVAKTPVTQKQYHLFISLSHPAHDVPYDTFGELADYSWNQKTRRPPEDKGEHPVVLVSAHDAEAYCNWLTGMLASKLPAGYRVMLPSEAEWERVARGPDSLKYPWGDWFDATLIPVKQQGTQAVATHHSDCKTSEDCFDIIGNVYEWTRSAYEDDDNERVLRGGCWEMDEPEESYRPAYRHHDEASYKDNVYGFRPVIVKVEE